MSKPREKVQRRHNGSGLSILEWFRPRHHVRGQRFLVDAAVQNAEELGGPRSRKAVTRRHGACGVLSRRQRDRGIQQEFTGVTIPSQRSGRGHQSTGRQSWPRRASEGQAPVSGGGLRHPQFGAGPPADVAGGYSLGCTLTQPGAHERKHRGALGPRGLLLPQAAAAGHSVHAAPAGWG